MSAGDESQILEIEDVIIHPKYDLSNAYQDIAVIKLKPNKGKLQISFTAGWNVWGDWFLAVNHYNYKIWVPFILTHNLWLIFTGMKQKKIKMADSKKGFGLVGLNDPKNTDVANNLCGCETVQHKLKNGLKHKKCIFCLVLSLCHTVSWPYKLSHINALRINQFY